MGGLPTYDCGTEFPALVPDLMGRHGITVEPMALAHEPYREDLAVFGTIYRYRLRRGRGTVEMASFPRREGSPLSFTLTCGGVPLYWPADMRLLREVESIALSQGAKTRGH